MGGLRRRTSSAATGDESVPRRPGRSRTPPVTAAVAAARRPRPPLRRRLRRPQPDPPARAGRAKPFGFPRAIAHGMWTKARCLAALRLPDAFTAEVRFKKPILLPAKVTFGEAEDRFAVHGHLEGVLSGVDVLDRAAGELLGRASASSVSGDRAGEEPDARCRAPPACRRRSRRRARPPPRTGWRARRRRRTHRYAVAGRRAHVARCGRPTEPWTKRTSAPSGVANSRWVKTQVGTARVGPLVADA